MTPIRRPVSALIAVVTALIATAVAWTPTSASASSYYEYWGYWHKPSGSGAWQYSHIGDGGYYLPQGKSVEGWRYAIGTASPSDPEPRPTGVTYDSYCGTKNASATYRVLLVVDYGTASGAPSGPVYSCYGFNDSTTGSQVLTQQHSVRDSGGLVCGIDGYPSSGCGDTVESPAPTHPPAPRPTAASRSRAPNNPSGSTVKHHHSGGSDAPSSAPVGATATATPPPRGSAAASVAPTSSLTAATTTSAQPGDAIATTPTAQPSAVPFTGAPAGKSSTTGTLALVAGLAAIVVLGGGALWRARRNRGGT